MVTPIVGLDGGLQRAIDEIPGDGIGNIENVAILHRLIRILPAQHATAC